MLPLKLPCLKTFKTTLETSVIMSTFVCAWSYWKSSLLMCSFFWKGERTSARRLSVGCPQVVRLEFWSSLTFTLPLWGSFTLKSAAVNRRTLRLNVDCCWAPLFCLYSSANGTPLLSLVCSPFSWRDCSRCCCSTTLDICFVGCGPQCGKMLSNELSRIRVSAWLVVKILGGSNSVLWLKLSIEDGFYNSVW